MPGRIENTFPILSAYGELHLWLRAGYEDIGFHLVSTLESLLLCHKCSRGVLILFHPSICHDIRRRFLIGKQACKRRHCQFKLPGDGDNPESGGGFKGLQDPQIYFLDRLCEKVERGTVSADQCQLAEPGPIDLKKDIIPAVRAYEPDMDRPGARPTEWNHGIT